MQVLLAQDDCSPGAKATDDLGILGGDAIFLRSAKYGAGGGSADSSDIDDVLQSDGNAVKRAKIGSVVNFPLGVTGALQGGFGGDRNVGVEYWVELGDAIEAVVRKFNRRNFSVANFQA